MPEAIAIYRRVSTDLQDNSLAAQETRIDDYLRYKQLHTLPAVTLTDPDTSGAIPLHRRAGGARLWELIRSGQLRHLVVAKLDRLGRSVADLIHVLDAIHEHKVDLHIVDLGINTHSPQGKLMFTLMGAFAEFELQTIRERIRTVKAHQRRQNILTGTVPYGWRARPTGRFNKRGRPILTLHPDPDQQYWIAHARNLRSQGWSYARIARDLNSRGVPTKTPAGTPITTSKGHTKPASGLWSPGNIHHILNNHYTNNPAPAPPDAATLPTDTHTL